MIAIFKREIMNYLKRPLFWVGVLLVIYGVFNATSPYLTTHYLTTGEKIINDQSNTSVEGEVYKCMRAIFQPRLKSTERYGMKR